MANKQQFCLRVPRSADEKCVVKAEELSGLETDFFNIGIFSAGLDHFPDLASCVTI